jgi:hypothetical protein
MDPSRPIQVLCSASIFYRGQAACDFSSEGLGSFVDEITTMSISYKWANFQFINIDPGKPAAEVSQT